MVAPLVGAIDQHATNARRAHFAEGYLLAMPDHSISFARVIAGDFGS
jgi:hypothetical protein